MARDSTSNDPVWWQQVLALLVAVLGFVACYVLVTLMLGVLHFLQGSADSILNRIFRDIVGPFAGAWLSISFALGCLKRSTPRFVFLGFAVTMLLLIGAAMTIGLLAVQRGDVTIWSVLWAGVCLAASLFGAYQAASAEGFEL
jgi:hypothetical protein